MINSHKRFSEALYDFSCKTHSIPAKKIYDRTQKFEQFARFNSKIKEIYGIHILGLLILNLLQSIQCVMLILSKRKSFNVVADVDAAGDRFKWLLFQF